MGQFEDDRQRLANSFDFFLFFRSVFLFFFCLFYLVEKVRGEKGQRDYKMIFSFFLSFVFFFVPFSFSSFGSVSFGCWVF